MPTPHEQHRTDLYFEAHVTIEPVFDAKLQEATELAQRFGFKIANLLMQKRAADTPERSQHDTFMTMQSKNYSLMEHQIRQLTNQLQRGGFKVWRVKIENTLMDTRFHDPLRLLL